MCISNLNNLDAAYAEKLMNDKNFMNGHLGSLLYGYELFNSAKHISNFLNKKNVKGVPKFEEHNPLGKRVMQTLPSGLQVVFTHKNAKIIKKATGETLGIRTFNSESKIKLFVPRFDDRLYEELIDVELEKQLLGV